MGKLFAFPKPKPADRIDQAITISLGGESYTLNLSATIERTEPTKKATPAITLRPKAAEAESREPSESANRYRSARPDIA